MSELDTYLTKHFLNAEQFAAACSISANELADLIQRQLIPAPSYVVTDSGTVKSYVFGEMAAPGSLPGDYFHPANTVWVNIARGIIANAGPQAAYQQLKERFTRNFHTALAELNATTWRLRDSFNDDGSLIIAGLGVRIESLLEHFLQGTFGLCVANPISEAVIARKEVLQEKLSKLSENGFKVAFSAQELQTILEVIDAYAEASMPFSPVEYHKSSRKRLVEDLRIRIANAVHLVNVSTVT